MMCFPQLLGLSAPLQLVITAMARAVAAAVAPIAPAAATVVASDAPAPRGGAGAATGWATCQGCRVQYPPQNYPPKIVVSLRKMVVY